MLGAITGDVVGSVYEFDNTKDYHFKLLSKSSNYTDDSVMTVAVADWLLTDPELSYQGLEESLLTYAREHPCPMGDYGGGFRTWLFHPEQLYDYDDRHGRLPYRSATGRHPYGSWGNGSAMRASAVGWCFDTLEQTEHVAEISAAITHNHPEGIKGAQATAAAVWMARNGKSKEEIRSYISRRFGYDLRKTWQEWRPIYGWEDSCQGTVPQAIICLLDSTDFEDAIRKAVSLGGDSDTLACITGGIAEAFYGGVPGKLASKILDLLPDQFLFVLSALQSRTAYGQVCPIADARVSKIANRKSWQTQPMPEKQVTVPLDIKLSDAQMARLRRGHIPEAMEDHWFMYCDGKFIHYHRSWTGYCIFEAAYEKAPDGYRVTSLTINQDPEQHTATPEEALERFRSLLEADAEA